MRVALVYPPACDPTAPYLALPMLAGFLRAHGVEVSLIDANVEAFDRLLAPEPLAELRDRLEARLAALERRATLAHEAQLEHAALAWARGDAHAVVGGIAGAKEVLRSESRFFDPELYGDAAATVDAALRVISATHHPLFLDFTAYRTPLGLTSMEEIERASGPERDPFHDYVARVLVARLREQQVGLVGLSVCFPGQLQPAYAFAQSIRRALPDVHLTFGGPGVTQMLLRLSGERLAHALGPFDSACLFEGEHTLLGLVRALDERRPPRELANVVVRDRLCGARWLAGDGREDLRALPAPDFDGMPLDRYLSPRLVLPYDPTRGCYWGRCTFCHYGLSEAGTAAYRERDVERVVEHLRALGERYRTRHFYFSQDSVAPKTLVKLAHAIVREGLEVRWATDLKPERYLTRERAETLRSSGAVACALGLESGSPRVLALIDKGAPVRTAVSVIERLSAAGIAAEAMCFTDFPTETRDEALETLDLLDSLRGAVALYIVGEFGLTHGSLVAREPARFGIRETWELEGDRLGLGIFFEPAHASKSDADREQIEARLAEVSRGWWLRGYPWAGAVSTAHTVLYYDRFGAGVFRDLAERGIRAPEVMGRAPLEATMRFDPRDTAAASEREAEIWSSLVGEERRIGRDAYESLAGAAPELRPQPLRIVFLAGHEPVQQRRARA